MFFIEKSIGWDEVYMIPIYILFVIAAIISSYLVYKSETRNKGILWVICFIMMTGNLNERLTIVIPGFNLFEIQPDRLVFFLLFGFFGFNLIYLRSKFYIPKKTPWFLLVFFLFLLFVLASQFTHISHMSIADVIVNVLYVVSFGVVVLGMCAISDQVWIRTVAYAMIIGAGISSVVGLVQLGYDPMFMRYGDFRPAFGDVIRCNGIFSTEYFNSYFILIAMSWMFHLLWDRWYSYPLAFLFAIAIVTTFHRMSWLIMVLVLAYYILKVIDVPWYRLIVFAQIGIAAVFILAILFQSEFQNSSFVKERLNEKVDSRFGYYAMVMDHIGKKPIFGYGDNNNKIYYENLLRITGSRDRASGETGDLHSGYFSSLWYYGFPGLTLFVLFVLSACFYFFLLARIDIGFSIFFIAIIIFIMANFTNTLLFDKYLSFLLAIHIGLGLRKRFDLEETTETNQVIC